MGTSTVSGPFRSQNGFQELVNGVWTPVGGGGGGGGMTIVELTDANKWATFTTGETGNPSIQLPQMNAGETIRVIQTLGAGVAENVAGDVFLWKVDLYGPPPGPTTVIDISIRAFLANNPDPYPVQFFSYNNQPPFGPISSLYLYKGGVFEYEGEFQYFYVDIQFMGSLTAGGMTGYLYRIISPGYIKDGGPMNWGSNPLLIP